MDLLGHSSRLVDILPMLLIEAKVCLSIIEAPSTKSCLLQSQLAVVEADARSTQHATAPMYRKIGRCTGNAVTIFRCYLCHRNRD